MTSLQKLKYVAACAAVLIAFAGAQPARAQDMAEPPTGLLPAESAFTMDAQISSNEETHPPLRLTPDRSEIVYVKESIERVIIGNDTNINVLMDTARRLIIVPRAPGATHFTLLGEEGKVVMQRYVIVANPKEKYIRIRETCLSGSCEPLRMYYCPGMCHELTIPGASSGRSGISDLSGDSAPEAPAPESGGAGGAGPTL